MSITGEEYSEEINEFEVAGLTQTKCNKIHSIRCEEAAVTLECILREVKSFGKTSKSGNLVLADVVAIHVDDSVIDWPKIDSSKIDVIGRLSESYYSTTRDPFKIE